MTNTTSPLVDWAEHEFTVGDHLRKARNDAGITAENLARILGTTRNTVLSYETDKIQSPQLDIVLQWCLNTHTKPSDIHERYAFYNDAVFAAVQNRGRGPLTPLTGGPELEVVPQWLEDLGSDASGWTYASFIEALASDPDECVHMLEQAER